MDFQLPCLIPGGYLKHWTQKAKDGFTNMAISAGKMMIKTMRFGRIYTIPAQNHHKVLKHNDPRLGGAHINLPAILLYTELKLIYPMVS